MPLEFSSLASGSSGNCQLIKTKNTTLLLDAGLSGKYILNALSHYNVNIQGVDGIVITHEHTDHVMGLGILHRKAGIPIYINESTWQAVKGKLGQIDRSKIFFIDKDKPFDVKDILITPMPVSHDAVDPLCFSFQTAHSKVSIVTDLGCIDEALIRRISDSNLIMLEANHNVNVLMSGKYPYPLKKRVASDLGHLSNEDCARAAIETIKRGSVSTVLLAHLSKENNTPQLAYETVKSAMAEEKIIVGKDVRLDLTYRDRTGQLYKVFK